MQQLILEALLSMSSDYWRQFNNRAQAEQENQNRPNTRVRSTRFSSVGRAKGVTMASTPQVSNKRSSIKKIYFHDSPSPQDSRQAVRPKRNYFD